MWRIRLLVAATMLSAAAGALANEPPFDAYVVPTEAEVYSSPVEPRYATCSIPRGTKIEVYDQRDEWLGIRPPAGSYSWVRSDSMTMTEEPGVAEAAEDGVASWIGSSAARVKEHHTSVQLKRGERVEILGKKEVEDAEGQREVWLKIAPPAGEFRWLHASQVSRDAPAAFTAVASPQRDLDQRDENAARGSWTAVSRRTTSAERSEAVSDALASTPQQRPSAAAPFRRSSMELRDLTPAPVRQAAFPTAADSGIQLAAYNADEQQLQQQPQPRAKPLSPDGFVPRKGGRTATRNMPGRSTSSPSPAAGRIASAPSKPAALRANGAPITPIETSEAEAQDAVAGISSAAVQRRLEEIDVSLSLMVSRDRTEWNLPALKRETQQLVENGATAVDRGEARFMLEKIERFAEAFGVESDDPALDLPLGSVAARKAALEAATAPKYDGAGYLTAVRARKPLAPYALLDEQGNHLYYVTPVPGFNLRSYENRKIGVFGKRGYMPDAKAAHLLAERVVDLDKQVR